MVFQIFSCFFVKFSYFLLLRNHLLIMTILPGAHSPFKFSRTFLEYLYGLSEKDSWGRILGRNSGKISLLFTVTSTAWPWDFYVFKLTQPLAVSRVQLLFTVKEKGRKPDRKPYPFHMVYEIHTETSSLRTLKIMPRNGNEIVRWWIWLLGTFY